MSSSPDSTPTADVIVIGGGIIGCSIAWRLAQARLKVLVLDRGEPGCEASSAAAGMLAPQGERVEPKAFADLCVASRELYPRFAAEVEECSAQRVGYRADGTLLVAEEEEELKELEGTYQAQTNNGFKLEWMEPLDVHRRIRGLSSDILRGLFVPGDHWVDNERLSDALVESARRVGVTFCARRPVTKLHVRGSRVESLEATYGSDDAARSRFSADHYILAAGCWSEGLVAPLGLKLQMQPCRGQMLEFEAPEDLPLVVRAGLHYLVPRGERRVLVGTTVEYVGFEKAVTGEGMRAIISRTTRFAPLLDNYRLRRAWAGLRPDTADHLPLLGYGDLENLLFATGHFRNGILLAPITAQLVSELLLTGSSSAPLGLYRPTRFQ